MSAKWRQIKTVFRYCEGIAEPILQPQFPMVFDLGSDPGEQYNLFNDKLDMVWMLGIAFRTVGAYEKSIAQYPNIKPGQEFTGYKTALPKSA